MIAIETLTLRDIQPSQFYISAEKMRKISLWFDGKAMDKFQPIPIKILDGIPVITDGHTRVVYAIQQGLENVPMQWDEDNLNWEMYRKCVEACRKRGITSPYDLSDRIVSAEEYVRKWDAWCDALHRGILE
ncbi:MAG: hypothetical protein Q4Q17_04500 [Tissierellia bacterium]|nr:hypothetical protein [Tissierellia bacterium]